MDMLRHLPRESDIRGALNRYIAFLDSQSSLLQDVCRAAIGQNEEFGVLAQTTAIARKLAPIAVRIDDTACSDLALRILRDYAWLWPTFAKQKPSFGQLLWISIPRDWHNTCREIQRLLNEGCSGIFPDESLLSVLLARNYRLAALRSNTADGLRYLRSLDETEIRNGDDLSIERLFLYHRLLRTLLAVQVGKCGNPAALRIFTEEVWLDWTSHTPDERHCLRPLFARSLRELIPQFEHHVANAPSGDELAPSFTALLSLAGALGNRPERQAVERMSRKILTDVDKAGKAGKSERWDPVRQFDLRLTRGKARQNHQVLVISQPLKTKNRDAQPFERLTQPLPVHQVRPKQVERARAQLIAEFPWLTELTSRLCDEIAASLWFGERFARFSPILLVSPPGIGKTRYARRLAELLRTPLAHVVMNGMQSSMQLKGSSAGWGESRPSVFIEHLLWLESANYFVLLDEIDKTSTSDHHGNPLDVLLSVLERENAKRFADECLGAKVDLSRLSYLATANDISRLPRPLLSRFRVIEVAPPRGDQLTSVVLAARDDRAQELGIDPRMLPLMADEVVALAKAGRSPREVVRLTLDYLMRRELASVRNLAPCH